MWKARSMSSKPRARPASTARSLPLRWPRWRFRPEDRSRRRHLAPTRSQMSRPLSFTGPICRCLRSDCGPTSSMAWPAIRVSAPRTRWAFRPPCWACLMRFPSPGPIAGFMQGRPRRPSLPACCEMAKARMSSTSTAAARPLNAAGAQFPFPPDMDEAALRAHVPPYAEISVAEGIEATHSAFARLRSVGRLPFLPARKE